MDNKQTAIRVNNQPDLPLLNNLVLQVIQRLTVLNELEMEHVIQWVHSQLDVVMFTFSAVCLRCNFRNVTPLLVALMVVIANPNRVPQVIQLIIVQQGLQMDNVIL